MLLKVKEAVKAFVVMVLVLLLFLLVLVVVKYWKE